MRLRLGSDGSFSGVAGGGAGGGSSGSSDATAGAVVGAVGSKTDMSRYFRQSFFDSQSTAKYNSMKLVTTTAAAMPSIAGRCQVELLLPKRRRDHYPVLGVNRPAREISGDFYDSFELPDGRIAFAIGDVSGKGLDAALLMVRTASLLRWSGKDRLPPGVWLERVNDELAETVSGGMFVCAAVGYYDPKRREVEWANAGFPPALVKTKPFDGPRAPVAPASPLSPLSPLGSWLGAKSTALRERLATFAEFTAPWAMSARFTARASHRGGCENGCPSWAWTAMPRASSGVASRESPSSSAQCASSTFCSSSPMSSGRAHGVRQQR